MGQDPRHRQPSDTLDVALPSRLGLASPQVPPWWEICITNTGYLALNTPRSKSYQVLHNVSEIKLERKESDLHILYIEVYIKVEAQIRSKKESNLHK